MLRCITQAGNLVEILNVVSIFIFCVLLLFVHKKYTYNELLDEMCG